MSLNVDKSMWTRVEFGDVVRNVNETVRNPDAAGINRVIAMEHLDPGELKIQRWGDLADGTTFTRRVKPGQTLFGKRRAYQRKVAFAEFEAVCSGDIYTFEADEAHMLPEFLPFLVQSNGFFDHALGTSAGSLSPRTNWRDLAGYEFDLPPLDEQKRIADLLWATEHHRLSLQGANEQVSTAFEMWLTRRLGRIATKPLGEIVTLQHGRPVPSALYGTGTFPLLRPGDMKADGRVIRTETSVTIPEDFASRYADWVLRPGDLAINMTAQSLEDRFLGRVCQIRHEALLNQRIGRLVTEDQDLRDYLFVALRTEAFANWVKRKSEGSKVKHMHWRHIADYPVPLPSTEEQVSVVQEAASWAGSVDALVAERKSVEELRASLLSTILGGP